MTATRGKEALAVAVGATTSTTRQAVLRDMMERDLFETYSARVNAAFQFLDDKNVGTFGVNDLANAEDFIFRYLGISLDKSRVHFSMMDVFRRYDVSGDGRADLIEFVSGTIEQLRKIAVDEGTLLEIAMEMVRVCAAHRQEVDGTENGTNNNSSSSSNNNSTSSDSSSNSWGIAIMVVSSFLLALGAICDIDHNFNNIIMFSLCIGN